VVRFEVAAVARSTDAIRVTGAEPARIAVPGAEAELTVAAPRSAFGLLVGGGVGGSWYFEEGTGYHARTSYTEWRGHAGIVAAPLRSNGVAFEVAALAEYGELRSWLENANVSQSGPRGYFVGGGLKLRAVGRPLWQLRPTLGLQADVFRAHADDPESAARYAWIGTGASMFVGLRY